MPELDHFQSKLMDLPVNLPELEQAAAGNGKSPSLPYEFFGILSAASNWPSTGGCTKTMLKKQ
jgi:hypothetical protein